MMEMAFDIPFEEQLEFFRQKGFEISPDSWRDVWKEAHARAFTVAQVTKMDVLVDIRKEIDRAIEKGIPYEKFKKNLVPMLERKGWLAPKGEKAIEILPDGTMRKRLTGWRLRTIYQTNMAASYHVGRYKQMMAVKDARPFWQYRSQRDPSVREAHRALDGKVYHADHPFWDKWYPPNGFNCRCYVKSLSPRDMEARGLKEETRGVKEQPDEGWEHNVGKAGLDHWKPDFARYSAREQELLKKALASYKAPKASAASVAWAAIEKLDAENVQGFMSKENDYARYKETHSGDSMLTETEYCITKGYTGPDYYNDINGTLITRAGETYRQKFEMVREDWMESIVRQMNRAIDKLPKPDVDTVLRGIDLPDHDFVRRKFKEGATVVLNGYQSTSLSNAYPGNVVFKIRLTRKQGGMVSGISDVPSQNEFLMKHGLRFKVLKVREPVTGKFKIELEEL